MLREEQCFVSTTSMQTRRKVPYFDVRARTYAADVIRPSSSSTACILRHCDDLPDWEADPWFRNIFFILCEVIDDTSQMWITRFVAALYQYWCMKNMEHYQDRIDDLIQVGSLVDYLKLGLAHYKTTKYVCQSDRPFISYFKDTLDVE